MFAELKMDINKEHIGESCINLFGKHGKKMVLEHTLNVVKKTKEIAQMYNLQRNALVDAAFLHDISVVVSRSKYCDICRNYKYNVLPVERELPILLHQRVSRIMAEQVFEIQNMKSLSAIYYHTTLKTNPSDIDMALFIADKLEWDQQGNPPYKKVVEKALKDSLQKACFTYITYVLDNNMLIIPHPDLISAKNYLKAFY